MYKYNLINNIKKFLNVKNLHYYAHDFKISLGIYERN